MKYDEQFMPHLFSARDYDRGRQYMRSRRVLNYRETWDGDSFTINCHVVGSTSYRVSIEVFPFMSAWRFDGSCTCPWFAQGNKCKHMAAALLTHFDLEKHPEKYPNFKVIHAPRTNDAARRLLRAMRDSGEPEDEVNAPEPNTLARVVPVLTLPDHFERNFFLGVKVGRDKLYVVKDIGDFVRRVERKETFSYGKNLTLDHDISNFDEASRKLIDFIRNTISLIEMGQLAYNRYGFHAGFQGHGIPLSPKLFAHYYNLLSEMPVIDGSGHPIQFMKGDPRVRAEFAKSGETITLSVKTDDGWSLAGDGDLLCVKRGAITLLSPEFSRNIAPLLLEDDSVFRFAIGDMPAFCSLVLPRIREGVDIVDPDGVLADHMPDECVPRFYFDYENGRLSCRLVLHYEGGDYLYGVRGEVGRRDIRVEDAAARALRRDLPRMDSRNYFFDDDPDRILSFLSGPIDAYRERGEVYISDRLRDMELRPSKTAVSVSMSGGMLSLSFDTGGFPPEELEALYQSLLARRRYHRLKDGRFMRLDGDASDIEALAETANMTQLTPKELQRGEACLPMFRALYLDGVLENRNGMRVKRDEHFKELIRRFKTVAESDYALPEGIEGELRPYQETGYRWLKTLESAGFGGILADEMGLGKTLQAIVFFASRPRSDTGLPHLVACPASLVLNWEDELRRFAPRLKIRLIIGSLRERRKLLAEADDADVWVTSYDLLKRDVELYEGREFYSFVLDEGQFVKNQSTKASKAVKAIACRQRFVLTGTPVENRLSELWNLFDFLMPGYLFAHQRFVEKLEKPIAQKGDAEARQQLNRMVRPFILRRLKRDVLKELPDKIEHVRRIRLSESERKVYHAQSLAALDQLGDGSEKLAILAALTRLRQICCDPGLCFENYEGEASKLEACLELVRSMSENGHQILVFSQFTSMLDRIRERLDGEGITSFTLQGSTPREERARLVKAFNRSEAQVFLISLKAGGTGLNLTAADVVIHYDPWWNVAAQNQATDRAHRIGQQNCVQVYKLIAGDTVEERILELQDKKAELLDAVTENAGEDISRMSKEDLLALIRED